MDNRSGKVGEDYTARLLLDKGYTILARNYHSRYGEIDIIARDGKYIIFVEVKTRAVGAKGSPLEAVTRQKRQRLLKTALVFLGDHPALAKLQCRFDVAGLTTKRGGQQILEVQYLSNAFGLEEEMA